ncbi:hypothetical protein SSX86_027954 [Deinandra increscens subsp. villosa]|uniref:F-box domain-containing protein n=1 Tax=Deinandra increscens subsp. villosa TaxID=3103831 RepID=A0AAP0GJX9_9ASTR
MEDSNHQSTLSSAVLIGFNDDLLTEILLRLPVSSILRFKSVSKHWRWLLSHRSFTLRFDKLLKSPGLFLRNVYVPFDVEDRSPPPFRTLDFCFDPHGIRIVQSCNGLLLCCSDTLERADCKYYVFNPTTKQYAIIPSVTTRDHETIRFMGLAFNETDCVHYKIICIYALEPFGKLFQIQMYSSNIRQWKISIESFSMDWPFSLDGVYCNKAFHWCSIYRHEIYSFKVDVEQMQTMPLPVMSSGDFHNLMLAPLYFGESRGYLHLVESPSPKKRFDVNVYEMLMDHSVWFLKYHVELDELSAPFSMIDYLLYRGLHVCDVVRGEKEGDTFMVVCFHGRMIRYNVHDKSFEQIFSFTKLYEGVHRYTETLALL